MPPKVLNKRSGGVPPGAVYIGRPTKWGNPYSHMTGTLARHKVATRDEAVDAYHAALRAKFAADPNALIRLQTELRGKDLVCWCAPARCHGDVLLHYANLED